MSDTCTYVVTPIFFFLASIMHEPVHSGIEEEGFPHLIPFYILLLPFIFSWCKDRDIDIS